MYFAITLWSGRPSQRGLRLTPFRCIKSSDQECSHQGACDNPKQDSKLTVDLFQLPSDPLHHSGSDHVTIDPAMTRFLNTCLGLASRRQSSLIGLRPQEAERETLFKSTFKSRSIPLHILSLRLYQLQQGSLLIYQSLSLPK